MSDYGTANFVRECSADNPGAAIYCAPEVLNASRDRNISCKVSYSYSTLPISFIMPASKIMN